MLVVGLTGGIASGKSAVSDCFARHGVPVIDTDVLAREVVQPGQPALQEIADTFGSDYIDAEGKLDRGQLRRTVFANPGLRKKLEAILHPRIRQALNQRLAALKAPYCLVVIPLLAETGMQTLVQRVLVVDVPESIQIQRVMARDRIDEDQARHILAAQSDRKQRLALADDVVENDGDISELEAKVANLHQKYLTLAKE